MEGLERLLREAESAENEYRQQLSISDYPGAKYLAEAVERRQIYEKAVAEFEKIKATMK